MDAKAKGGTRGWPDGLLWSADVKRYPGRSKIKQAIKNVLGMLVMIMTIGCGPSQEDFCLYTDNVTTIAVATDDVNYNGDPIIHRAEPMCNDCKIVRTYKNHTVEIQNEVCIVKCNYISNHKEKQNDI
jgi:hypothetical protein